MDQLGNDCPCKRQRVSEGEEIDEETGIPLQHASESLESDIGTENHSLSRDTTLSEKGDTVSKRGTIQWKQLVGGAGDLGSNSNLAGEGNQSINLHSYIDENSAQPLGNQTGSKESHENLVDVKTYSLDVNQPMEITRNMQSSSGFCEYVQNVQAIAENSYIRNRDSNTSKINMGQKQDFNKSKTHMDKTQILESPKLKRPMDRINTNLVKKRIETLPNSALLEKKGLSKTDSENNGEHNTLPPNCQLTLQTIFADTATTIKGNQCNVDIMKKPEVDDNVVSDNTRNIDMKVDSARSSIITDNKGLQTDGFNASCFEEMFTNSVMGNIMSSSRKAGNLRNNLGKQLNNEVYVDTDKTEVINEFKKENGGVSLNKFEVHGDGRGDRTLRIEDKICTNVRELDENLEPKIIQEPESSREICQFQGLGNLLSDIGGSDESGKHLVKAGVVDDPASLRSEFCDSNNLEGPARATVTCDSSSKMKTHKKSKCSPAGQSQTGQSLINNALNEDTGENSGKEATDGDKNKTSLIDGRFKLSFNETQLIVNQGNINRLPVTVIVHILKNLTAFQLLRRASCVCKYWYNLCRDPDIWRSISLVNQHRLTDFDFKRILHFSDYRVRFLNLTDSRFVTNNSIKYLIMSCPQLEELRLMRCFDLTDAAFDGLSSVGVCSNLQALYMDGCCRITDKTVLEVSKACHRLRILNLNQCTRISDTSVIEIAQKCPRLTNLQLDHCSQVTDRAMSEIVLGCPEILYLNLMSCGITDTGVKYLSNLMNLSNLDLSNIPRLTSDSVIYVSEFCKNLQCINVSLNTVMDDQCISHLAKNLPLLKRLYCVSCSITDKGLEDLARCCPNLEALDVGWCQEVTDHGVRVISLACKCLDYFGLIRCDRVTLETIEELVLKYPRINYSTFILESRRLLERARNEGYQFKMLSLP